MDRRVMRAIIIWLIMTAPTRNGDALTLMTTLNDVVTPAESSTERPSTSVMDHTSTGTRNETTMSTLNTSSASTDDCASSKVYNDTQVTNTTLGKETLLPPYMRNEGLMSKVDFERLCHTVSITIVPILIVGICTNTVAIVVFRRMPSSVTSSYFSLSSGLDVFYMAMAVPSTFASLLMGQTETSQSLFYAYYVKCVSNYVIYTTRKVVICVTMLMSLDRYLVVAFPIRMRSCEHVRQPLLYALMVVVMVFILDTNVLLKTKVMSEVANDKQTTYTIVPTQLYSDNQQLFNNFSLISSVMFQYIPLILLFVFNVLLISALVKHFRQMKSFSEEGDVEGRGNWSVSNESKDSAMCSFTSESGQIEAQMVRDKGRIRAENCGMEKCHPRREKSVTVLAYSFLFTLLALPSTFYPLFRKLIPEFTPFSREHYLVLALITSIFVLLDTFSASMNFFVYLSTGSAFRDGVKRLFGFGRRAEDKQTSSVTEDRSTAIADM